MNKVFFGLLLTFLDINLNLSGHTLDILPDWAGYCLIYSGLKDLSGESDYFTKAQPWCMPMVVYSAIVWALEILFGEAKLGIIGFVLSLAALLVSLYISYLIIEGIGEIEHLRGINLMQAKLKNVWMLYAICGLIACFLGILVPLALICLIVAVVAGIIFLVRLNTTRKAYNQAMGL